MFFVLNSNKRHGLINYCFHTFQIWFGNFIIEILKNHGKADQEERF